MNSAKAIFLRHEFSAILSTIPFDKNPAWGKMTLQQMVEHFSDSVRIASGKTIFTVILTRPNSCKKVRDFFNERYAVQRKYSQSITARSSCPGKKFIG